MAHRVLHVDKSILNPEKQQLLRECLHESCELVIPESFDTETILHDHRFCTPHGRDDARRPRPVRRRPRWDRHGFG